MTISTDPHRPFGNTGLRIPPLIFGIGPLANKRRVIPDQTKLELCGEWFRHVAPAVAIDISPPSGDGRSLEVLARAFQRLDIAPDEVLLIQRFGCSNSHFSKDSFRTTWDQACQRLGGNHRPQLLALDSPDDYLAAAKSPADRTQRLQNVFDSVRALDELKASGDLAGVGVAARDWQVVQEIDSAVRLDWVMFVGCYTIMRHPPELLEFMSNLAARQIPIVVAGIFHCDFLTGGSAFDSRTVDAENPADRSMIAWRKAFVALCHGHGITPVHACIQFALAGPGVTAVVVNTSHRTRVAENVASAIAKVPDPFWTSMKEEGLLNCS